MPHAIALLALLIGLELVLGVDNVLVISIFVGRLPPKERNRARIIGLGFAMLARILLVLLVLALAGLTRPLWFNLSVRDIILLAGGLFLLYKAVKEIHHTVEIKEEKLLLPLPAVKIRFPSSLILSCWISSSLLIRSSAPWV